jgi:uncharacterized membrane protein
LGLNRQTQPKRTTQSTIHSMARKVLLAGETWTSHRLEVRGLSSYSLGAYGEGQNELVAALDHTGHDVTHIANHDATERFPWTAADIADYDVAVLSDISADTLQLHPDCLDRGLRTPDRLRVLGDFVRRGGGLLMIGGYMSFSGIEGKAHYQATPLAEVLPVEMLGFDDRVEVCEGIFPEAVSDHALLAGLSCEWPHFLGYNRLRAKSDANVLLTFGNDPLLVVGQYGAGRVAAFSSDSSPHWGSPEFLAWECYGPFWSKLIDWLGDGNAEPSPGPDADLVEV